MMFNLRSATTLMLGVASLLVGSVAPAADAPCTACHADISTHFSDTAHGRALSASAATCAACHGDGQQHPGNPAGNSIRTFASEPVSEQNAVCTSCHQSAALPGGATHSHADLACTTCHSVHSKKEPASALPAGFDQVPPGSALCFECHEDVFVRFSFNERHRLAEGAVVCTSCHDPHTPRTGLTLLDVGSAPCADCHAEVTGPFVFEHAAGRVEGCTACHEPHGSPNRHLLKLQAVGSQCYSCHATVAQFHLGFTPSAPPPPRFDEDTVCTNCHTAIHGSNLDPHFLR